MDDAMTFLPLFPPHELDLARAAVDDERAAVVRFLREHAAGFRSPIALADGGKRIADVLEKKARQIEAGDHRR